MLNFIQAESVQDKIKVLQELDVHEDSLFVSDLRAKFEWQNFYLAKESVIAEEFIFRPSDLWKKFANYFLSDYQVVTNEFLLSYISTYLKNKEEDFLKSPTASQSLFAYLNQLSVVFEHPEGRDLLKEWFKEHVDSFHRWGHWYFVVEELWFHLKQEKLIAMSWVPALLLGSEAELAQVWNRKIYLDLSLELKYVEAELFSNLSRYLDVDVLLPRLNENSEFQLDFEAYRPFASQLNSETSFESFFEKKQNTYKPVVSSVKRFSSSLSEVKDCMNSLRNLLDTGVPANKIALVSCDIGEYWPVLRVYLEKEGIPCQRPYNTGVQSLLSVSRWLGGLKLVSKSWEREDLETSLYREEKPILNYGEFLRFYTKIYDASDLARKEKVFENYRNQIKENEIIGRDEFVVWALQQWKEESYPSVLEVLIKTLLSECPENRSLYLKDWLQYLAKLCAKQEVCIRPGSPEGVLCVDLSSLEYIDTDHVFIMGMSESSFKKNSPLKAVSQQDILSLRAQTGFPLSPEESRSFEYYLLWNFQTEKRTYYLSFPVTDFGGSISSPSLIWLKARKELDLETTSIDSPGESRMDQLQGQTLEQMNEKANTYFSEEAVLRDNGKEVFAPAKVQRFSPTGFRDFKQCPFKFAARYFLNLQKLPPVDLDVDRMKNGSIIHRLFELAVRRKIDVSEQKSMEALVGEVLNESSEELGHPALRDRYFQFYLKTVKRFLEFEKEWKTEFSATEYWQQEYAIDVFWNADTRKFQKEKTEGPRFRAIVDRMDRSNKEICIIDYKNSGAAYKNFSQWFEEDDYQLLFYSMLVHQLFSEEQLDIVGGVYYSLKPYQRSKGFIRKDADPAFLPSADRKRNKVSKEELLNAEEKLSELMEEFFAQVEEGQLLPKPKDATKLCGNCDWRTICRAKHLNS